MENNSSSVSLEPAINCGVIAISLPRGWQECGHDYFSTFGNRWTRSFASPEFQDVVITFHYRGHPVDHASTALLRRTLLLGPALIFDRQNASREQTSQATAFSQVLGNAGHNQLSTQQTGMAGPAFRLDKMRTAELNKRCVVLVQGAYMALDGGMIALSYGVIIDATPLARVAHLQEIHLSAPPGMSHEKVVTQFECMLSSATWLK